MLQPKVITIIGNVAAGKSSAMDIVADALGAEQVKADEFFQTTDPFREDFLKDQSRWALPNELWLTIERVKLITQAKASYPDKNLAIDSGVLMSWVYTYSHYLAGKITQAEWDLYQGIFDHYTIDLLQNLQIIYLDYPLETLMYRLKLRGRDYELAYYTESYLRELQAALDALIRKLTSQGVAIRHITEKDVPNFVNNKKDAERFKQLLRT